MNTQELTASDASEREEAGRASKSAGTLVTHAAATCVCGVGVAMWGVGCGPTCEVLGAWGLGFGVWSNAAGPRFHRVYGFSSGFGVSGFRLRGWGKGCTFGGNMGESAASARRSAMWVWVLVALRCRENSGTSSRATTAAGSTCVGFEGVWGSG